jgi:hypothetical protein
MRNRCAVAVAIAVLWTAACGEDLGIDATLTQEALEDATILELVSAASGYEAEQAVHSLVYLRDQMNDDPLCPSVVEDTATATVTLTGGCTTHDGISVIGSAQAIRHPGWGNDGTQVARYTFDSFRISGPFPSFVYDGTIEWGPTSLEMDLHIDTSDHVIVARGTRACENTSSCTLNAGVQLLDAGGALASGSLNGTWRLQGADVVEVTHDSSGCAHVHIVGGREVPVGCPR